MPMFQSVKIKEEKSPERNAADLLVIQTKTRISSLLDAQKVKCVKETILQPWWSMKERLML
jgi:hypothetical protein